MTQPTTAHVRVMIVGGGTAGHVLPGVAIGRELVERCLLYTSDAADE